MQWINSRLASWASDIDHNTILQAEKTARLPVVTGHVALMSDAHLGMGATVGSVIPTENTILPSAVGVDIGCGMIASRLDVTAADLPDDLEPLLSLIEQTIPAGVGQGHETTGNRGYNWLRAHHPTTDFSAKQSGKTLSQFGTLGSGNHFMEVCLDETDTVWIVLHSGSRGIGNELAQQHIKGAKQLAKDMHLALEDPDLAYFMQGTPEFDAYIGDMLWAQDYARANRDEMMVRALPVVLNFIGKGKEVQRVNCHHNFTAREIHDGVELWITRKGAIKADVGDLGVIPGSMGTRSYIVEGLGNPLSWNSCSHGAGRRMSRTAAKREFTVDDLALAMKGKTWLAGKAKALLDEIPSSYKSIEQVMADQIDLVRPLHELHQLLNYKGA